MRDDDDEDEDDRPRRKKRRRDDDEDDDHPRRRKKRTPKKSSSTGLILGLVGGVALLLLVGGGIAALVMLRKPADQPAANNKPAGGGLVAPGGGGSAVPVVGRTGQTSWVNFRQTDGLYSVKVPMANVIMLPPFSELKPFGSDKLSMASAASFEVTCHMSVKVLSEASLSDHIKNEKPAGTVSGPKEQAITWLGRAVVEEYEPILKQFKRTFRDGNRLFEFSLAGATRKPTDEEKAMFFDSVVLDPR